jgi:Lon protease-like protein
MNDESLELNGFNGVVRLFPLPDFVLFPHVVAPLHVFEPRYRQMAADALAGDRLLALVLLKPGYEADYEGTPAIFRMACLAQIMEHEKLADGRFNLVVRGVSRVRVEKELPTEKLYRMARSRAFPDAADQFPELRQEICDAALPLLPNQSHVIGQLKALFKSELPLGSLCDVLSFALPLETSLKQTLLEQVDAEARARRLIHELRSGAIPELLPRPREGWKFPPDFSPN